MSTSQTTVALQRVSTGRQQGGWELTGASVVPARVGTDTVDRVERPPAVVEHVCRAAAMEVLVGYG